MALVSWAKEIWYPTVSNTTIHNILVVSCGDRNSFHRSTGKISSDKFQGADANRYSKSQQCVVGKKNIVRETQPVDYVAMVPTVPFTVNHISIKITRYTPITFVPFNQPHLQLVQTFGNCCDCMIMICGSASWLHPSFGPVTFAVATGPLSSSSGSSFGSSLARVLVFNATMPQCNVLSSNFYL